MKGWWRRCEDEEHTLSMCRYIAAGYDCVVNLLAVCGCAVVR